MSNGLTINNITDSTLADKITVSTSGANYFGSTGGQIRIDSLSYDNTFLSSTNANAGGKGPFISQGPTQSFASGLQTKTLTADGTFKMGTTTYTVRRGLIIAVS